MDMTKIYHVLCFLVFGTSLVSAQIISFPDPAFKAKLLEASVQSTIAFNSSGQTMIIDTNNNDEIEVSEALLVHKLDVSDAGISNVEGIQYFANMTHFDCSYNILTEIDVNSLPNLIELICYHCGLTSLEVSNCALLNEIQCYGNPLTILDLSGLANLSYVIAPHNNSLTSVDVSGCTSLLQLALDYATSLSVIDVSDSPILSYLWVTHCPQLTTIFAKNGSNEMNAFDFSFSPNVNYICVDEDQITTVENLAVQYGNTNCSVNSYCNFSPGGNYYTIQGNTKFDANSNGCDASDPVFSGLKLSYSGGATGTIITGSLDNYRIDLPEGTYTITPVLENPTYFIVSPPNVSATFPSQASPLIQNFCISPNGTHNDLEVVLIPTTVARPGFDGSYKIIYKNKGTHPKSGNVTLTFQDDSMDYVSSNPVYTTQLPNLLSWDYTNLMPFEIREIEVAFNLNSPSEIPAVNSGDQLDFTSVVYPIAGDQVSVDNTSAIKQTVVGSFDPNDKTCLEGSVVSTSFVGNYVHYMIRFENTGNYSAENVVIKDVIDTTKFIVTSFVPLASSHSMVTRFTSTNKIEFIFEGINLPFDDANNDGYVAFKIKLKSNLIAGNSFSNSAKIYFDYNLPITTNTATTSINSLGNPDYAFSNYFEIAPNPVQNTLNIQSKNEVEVFSISISNLLGQLVLNIPNAKETNSIDVSQLITGTYFIKVISDSGTSNSKFIKE